MSKRDLPIKIFDPNTKTEFKVGDSVRLYRGKAVSGYYHDGVIEAVGVKNDGHYTRYTLRVDQMFNPSHPNGIPGTIGLSGPVGFHRYDYPPIERTPEMSLMVLRAA